MDVETNPDRSHGYDVDMTFILTSSQSAKSPKKQSEGRGAFLLIRHSKYSVVKNSLLQTAFSAILPTGMCLL